MYIKIKSNKNLNNINYIDTIKCFIPSYIAQPKNKFENIF